MIRTVSAVAALSFGVVSLGAIVWAEAPLPTGPASAPAKPSIAGKSAGPVEPNSLDVLRNRPDAPKSTQPSDALIGPDLIQFRAAGIAIRPIAESRILRKYGSDEIVEFVNDDRQWSLKVALIRSERPIGLTQSVDLSNNRVPGLIDVNIDRLKRELPAMKLLRKETVSIGDSGIPSEDPNVHVPNVGMLAIRYTKGVERLLSQQAIIQANEKLYYLITLTSPGRKDAVKPDAAAPAAPAADPAAGAADNAEVQVVTEEGSDPGEKVAVDAFEQVVESIKLLDRTKLKEDQDQRLFKTRSLFVNLTEKKLTSLIVPEQWFRVIQNNKDVGYVYSVEEVADGIPQRDELHRATSARSRGLTGDKNIDNGVLIGSRSRMKSGLRQIDSESWMFITMDRRHEDWSTITLVTDRKSGNKDNIMTLGTSDRQQSRSFDHEGLEKGYKGDQYDPNQPPVKMGEEYSLTVNRYAQRETPEPVTKRLPPFYLPQAMGYLLPRLVTLNIPKQYLFATYVPDMSQVMLRYVDVGEEQHVMLAGRAMRAIPISDKLGLDGTVTMHYMSRDGHYLGSLTKETGITIVPTDEKTLREIWKDADLSRPADVEQATNAAVSHAGPALINPTGAEPAQTPAPIGPPAPTAASRRLAPRDKAPSK